jgi:hypothetical protein
MQIEWSEGEVLKLPASARERRRGLVSVWELESMVEDGVKEGGK